MNIAFASVSWLDQLNSANLLPYGLKVEALLPVLICLLLYVAFEIIHNVELMECEKEKEARRRNRVGRLTGG